MNPLKKPGCRDRIQIRETSSTMPHEADQQPDNLSERLGAPSPTSDSTPTIQNGANATSTAARPLGTVCSAQTTAPLPRPISRTPRTTSDSHCCPRREASPRMRKNAMSRVPATTQRSAGHQQRRNRLNRDANGQIGRAPDQAEDDPGHVRAALRQPAAQHFGL